MTNKKIDKIIDIIKQSKSILITAHNNLDGDAIGSETALGLALKGIGKNVHILLKGQIPSKYKFLPCADNLIISSIPALSDTLIILDAAGWNQLTPFRPKNFIGKTIINIDHHIDNQRFGDINWVEPRASAAGELIYYLLKKMPIPLTEDIALCLYIAILTDTGRFQYSNTTATTHRIISTLLSHGVRPYTVSKHIYENIRLSELKLLQISLKTVKVKHKIIWAWVTKKMFKQAGSKWEDADQFIDYLKSVTDIKVALLFKETKNPGEIHVNFRSKDNKIFVNKIAKQFNGGGHNSAAGCIAKGSRKNVEAKILKAVKAALKK